MKTYLKILIVILLGIVSTTSWSQNKQTDNKYISSKLNFYYFDKASTADPYLINNSDVIAGSESGTFWTNKKLKVYHDYIKALLKNTSKGGDISLQYYTTRILKLNNKNIAIYLWNDTSPYKESEIAFTDNKPCLDEKNYVWPCAALWNMNFKGKAYGGYMHIGLHHAKKEKLTWLNETFLHELTHTQDATLDKGNSFIIFGIDYRYGADDEHYENEVTPSKRLAYMEAIANVPPMYYNFKSFQKQFKWFTDNGEMVVEEKAPPIWVKYMGQLFGSGFNKDVWLYDQIKNHPNGGIGKVDPTDNKYRIYKIQDLPSEFIIHNEVVLAMMMTMTSMHIAEIDPFLWSIKKFNVEIKSNQNQDPLALFIKIFAKGMLQQGESISKIKKELDKKIESLPTDADVAYPYILPLAYSDYFTAYKSSTKSDFKALFNDEMDGDLIDIYWDYLKDKVRSNVKIKSGRTWTDMTTIATTCGVKMSYVPGKSGRIYESN